MDPDSFIISLNRDHITISEKNILIKDLSLFVDGPSGRSLSDSIIVDKSIFAFQKQFSNGLWVPKYDGAEDDDVLLKLGSYLNQRFISA